MKTVFLVTWLVSVWVPTECPDFKPDPYTGQYPTSHCLVLHGKTIERKMEKRFETREEAEEFIAKAPENIRKLMNLCQE